MRSTMNTATLARLCILVERLLSGKASMVYCKMAKAHAVSFAAMSVKALHLVHDAVQDMKCLPEQRIQEDAESRLAGLCK